MYEGTRYRLGLGRVASIGSDVDVNPDMTSKILLFPDFQLM